MLDDVPELSQDLEWMMLSNQASRDMLVEALLSEYYASVYRLAFAVLGNTGDAHKVAEETFVEALQNAYRYREKVGVRPWLFGFALKAIHRAPRRPAQAPAAERVSSQDGKIWQVVNSHGERERLLLLLRYLLLWSPDEIAALLRVSEGAVLDQLELTRHQLYPVLHSSADLPDNESSNPPEGDLGDVRLDTLVEESLSRRWSALQLSPEELEVLAARVETQALRSGNRRRRIVYLMEIGLVGVIAVCVLGMALGISRWLANPNLDNISPGQPLANLSPGATGSVIYIVQKGDTLESIAVWVGMSVQSLVDLNDLLPDAGLLPGQRLLVVPLGSAKNTQTPPSKNPLPPKEPLEMSSDSWSILRRLRDSENLWRSLWVDVQVIDYGPVSFIGHPELRRAQAWIHQSDGSLELSGLLLAEPEQYFLFSGSHYLSSHSGSETILIDRGSGKENIPLNTPELHAMIFPTSAPWMDPDETFIPVEESQVAGRPALVVDWFDYLDQRKARLWVDVDTGVVLRLQDYGGDGFQTLLSDAVVSTIEYEPDFSSETLFDPQYLHQVRRSNYGSDSRGPEPLSEEKQQPASLAVPQIERPQLPYAPAPEGFDPSYSQLHFQFSPEATSVQTHTFEAPADIFADGYYLGRTEFVLPWGLACQRSLDGLLLAYIQKPDLWSTSNGVLRWFNLLDPGAVFQPLPDLTVSSFTFSPEGDYLAAFGYGRQDDVANGIYQLDVATGEHQLIIEQEYARSLAWSPDGAYLAWIGAGFDEAEEQAVVLHLKTGEIVYQTPYIPGKILPQWPVRDWGIIFPREMGDMDACAVPTIID